MRNLMVSAKKALSNECGGPNVEQIIGIGVALGVGVGLYMLGSTMYTWLSDAGSSSAMDSANIAQSDTTWYAAA